MSGSITGIDVRGQSSWVATLNLYNGGNGSGVPFAVGAPVYSQPNVTVTAVGTNGPFSHITLTTPFPVVAGNTYTFTLDDAGGGGFLWHSAPADYPNGVMILQFAIPFAGDLVFQIYEVATADLQVSQVASTTAATVGSTISYAVTFTNAGPNPATTVTVSDNLAAAGLVLLSAQSSIGALTTSSNSLSLAVGTLNAGATGTITVVASVSAGAGSITHTVSITSPAADPAIGNNTSVHLASRLAAPPPVAAAVAIPTLGEWALLAMASLLLALGLWSMRPTRQPPAFR